MRLLVISDTHGSFLRLEAAAARAGKVDAILHLGDYAADAATVSKAFGGAPYQCVRGNCDDPNAAFPRKLVVTYDKASLLLVHGDAYYTLNQLSYAAREEGCRAVLFGHTHESLLAADGDVLILNPGSLSRPKAQFAPSFAVVEITGQDVRPKIITL